MDKCVPKKQNTFWANSYPYDKHNITNKNIKNIQKHLTTICQKMETDNAILTTNGLTVVAETLLKIW